MAILSLQSVTRGSSASSDSVVDVESVHDLLHPADKSSPLPEPDQDAEAQEVSELQPEDDADIQTAEDVGEGKEKEDGDADEAAKTVGKDDAIAASIETVTEEEKEKEDKVEEKLRDSKENLQDKDGGAKDEDIQRDGEQAGVESGIHPTQEESIVVLDREESNVELTKILLEAFRR